MTNRLRICLLSREYPPETGWGGIGTYTYHLARGLAIRGHEVQVIAQSFERACDYTDEGVVVHRIMYKPLMVNQIYRQGIDEFMARLEYSVCVAAKIEELSAIQSFDVIEGPNFTGEAFVYSMQRTKQRAPLVTRINTSYAQAVHYFDWEQSTDRNLAAMLEYMTIMKSELVLYATQAHAAQTTGELFALPRRQEIVPFGIPLPLYHQNPSDATSCSVLFVGRLEKRKGVHVLARAIPLVFQECPEATFTIVGKELFVNSLTASYEGDAGNSLKTLMEECVPRDKVAQVRFTGFVSREELERYYAACDVFVAPSLYESFGLIYLEAMAHGKPVIGCCVGGVPEVVKDGETGLLVPPENHEALAAAIIQLLNDPSRRARMGAAARQDVEERFTVDNMVTHTEQVYQKIVET